MDDQPGLSDQYRMSSPWPLFVALGFVISEVGVFLNIIPLSVGGLLLFAGSVAGIIQESGYAERPWGTLSLVGGLLVALGLAITASQVLPFEGFPAALDAVWGGLVGPELNGVVQRGVSVLFAGVIALVASQVARLVERDVDAL
ncbi:cox cluster protein [Halomarina halobia]|uniref:Cox cluster protein n=1 Tax=Halomarina halobia TaxID=3033386 RepID=A0ABD6AC07_9EURY|nr:cox cluster protein [Halomarina sp. PSR21]